jgi:hypothetical protein
MVSEVVKMPVEKISPQVLCLVASRLLLKGSFVIAAICRDGIVLASESRANIFDKTDREQKPIAYYDGIQKLFPIRSVAMAETGQGLILNVFFSAFVSQFAQATLTNLKVDELLPMFINYCEQQFPLASQEIKKQKLFSAGYINNRPTICYFNIDQPQGPFGCIQDSGFIESDQSLLAEYASQLSSLSAQKLATVAKEAIQSYASHGERWKTIGGSIDVLLVTRNRCRWLDKSPTRNWKYIQDMIRDYRDGKLQLNLIPPATRKQLDDLLATVPV